MLAVGVSPQVKKKRKRTTESPLTKPLLKKKKVITTSTETPLRKKKSKISDAEVPELIICADQLKPDVKPEIKEEIKDEVDTEKITRVEVTNPIHVIPDIKIEANDEVPERLKKKRKRKKSKIKVEIKEEMIDPEISQPVLSTPKAPKKKKKKPKTSRDTTTEPELLTSKKVKKKKKSDVLSSTIIETEPLDYDDLYNFSEPVKAEDIIAKKFEIKDEKPEIYDEKPNLSTMFNSDVKQELLSEDHIDMQLVRNLSYSDQDPCIHHEITNLHCALPPVYAGRILEGVDMMMKKHSLKYMKETRGVLLNYSDIQLQSSTGRYLSTSPEFHFNIKCRTTSFKPKIDKVLTGTVVKTGPGYVNCLVYGYFTAVVYGRYQTELLPGTLINFKLKHYQQTSSDDLILKGVPDDVMPSS